MHNARGRERWPGHCNVGRQTRDSGGLEIEWVPRCLRSGCVFPAGTNVASIRGGIHSISRKAVNNAAVRNCSSCSATARMCVFGKRVMERVIAATDVAKEPLRPDEHPRQGVCVRSAGDGTECTLYWQFGSSRAQASPESAGFSLEHRRGV